MPLKKWIEQKLFWYWLAFILCSITDFFNKVLSYLSFESKISKPLLFFDVVFFSYFSFNMLVYMLYLFLHSRKVFTINIENNSFWVNLHISERKCTFSHLSWFSLAKAGELTCVYKIWYLKWNIRMVQKAFNIS